MQISLRKSLCFPLPSFLSCFRWLVVLLLSVCPLPLLAASAFDEVTAFADEAVKNLMDEQDLAGVGLALVYPGEAAWSRGHGMASRRDAVPFTAVTPNALHELAKPLLAIAILQLVERGLLDLDAPYRGYFPGFRPDASSAEHGDFTVRQLLSHHSGLPTWFAPRSGFAAFGLGGDWDDYREVLAHSEDLALVATPGQVYNYSYLGYVLLGLLIEEVSGLGFEAYVAANILDPLGMTGSWFGAVNEPRGGGPPAAGPWMAFDDGKETDHSQFRDLPAAGLVSSAADMALLLHALLNGGQGIVSGASLAEMVRPQNTEVREDGNFRMGLGFFLTPVTGGLFSGEASISHAATDGIARSYLLAFPQHGVGLLLTSNTALNSVALRDAVDRIAQQMLDSLAVPRTPPYAAHRDVAFDAEAAARLQGAYSGPGGSYYVELRRGRLRLDVPQLPFLNVRLQPREDGWFGVDLRFLGFGLGLLQRVRQLAASVEGKLDEVEGEKVLHWYWRGVTAVSLSEIPATGSDSEREAWKARASTFHSSETDWPYELRYDDRSGQFLFGPKPRGLRLLSEPAELLCVESAERLRSCARGLQGTGTRNLLRLLEDGSLLDAQGVRYTLRRPQ